MITTLIFDFGKVLVDYDFQRVIHQFFTNPQDEQEFVSIATTQDFIDKCDKEDVPFYDLIKEMMLKYPKYKDQFQMFYDRYPDFVTGEVPGMRQALTDLRARGFRLLGLTNWCSAIYEVTKRFDILTMLDGRVVSSEEKIIKPDPAIYLRLCDRFQVRPEECVFADDKAVNIEGARSVGMYGIVFRDSVQYLSELDKIISKR